MDTLPKLVLFDLDGTLYDNSEVITSIYSQIMKDLSLPFSLSRFQKLKGKTTFDTGRGLGISEDDLDYVDNAFWRYFRSYCDDLEQEGDIPHLNSCVEETMLFLTQYKVSIGVVTSNERTSASRLLSLSGLINLFPVIIGKEDTVKLKPFPEPLLFAASLLKITEISPITAWYIGDSASDVLAANSAGFLSILINKEYLAVEPDYQFQSFQDFYTWLKKF